MILVTGATGFVGSALGDVLSQGRRPILLLSRRARPPLGFEDNEVRAVAVDVLDDSALGKLPQEIRSIIHLAGEVPGVVADSPEHEETAMRLLLGLAKARKVERFVYLSATGASESSSLLWLRAKGRAERLLRDSQLPSVILRAGPVFSPEDRFFNALGQVVHAERPVRLPFFCTGSLRPIAAGDLAIALATALDHHVMLGKILDVGGPETVSLSQLLRLIAKRMMKKLVLRRGPWGGQPLQEALQQVPHRPMTEAATWIRWFSVCEGPDVSLYDRAIPIRRVSLTEELRSFAWGPCPPRPGDPLPVIQPKGMGIPAFIPAAHLREGSAPIDAGAFGRVDAFGRPQAEEDSTKESP